MFYWVVWSVQMKRKCLLLLSDCHKGRGYQWIGNYERNAFITAQFQLFFLDVYDAQKYDNNCIPWQPEGLLFSR